MPSPYSLGSQNAEGLFDAFVNGDLVVGNVTFTTTQTLSALAHGLSAAPDWCLLAGSLASAGIAADGIGWSATATTLTINKADTEVGGLTVSYLAGNLT